MANEKQNIVPNSNPKNYLKLSWVLFGTSFGTGIILIIIQFSLTSTDSLKLLINIIGYIAFILLIIGVLARIEHHHLRDQLTIWKITKNLLFPLFYLIFYYSIIFILTAVGLGLS